MPRLAILVALALALPSVALADPPGMSCQDVTIVRYSRGPEFASFAKHRDAHLAHLRKEMERGAVIYAGPIRTGEELTGGMSIYKGTDLKAIAASAEGDALIANKVMIYSTEAWAMCQPAPKAK